MSLFTPGAEELAGLLPTWWATADPASQLSILLAAAGGLLDAQAAIQDDRAADSSVATATWDGLMRSAGFAYGVTAEEAPATVETLRAYLQSRYAEDGSRDSLIQTLTSLLGNSANTADGTEITFPAQRLDDFSTDTLAANDYERTILTTSGLVGYWPLDEISGPCRDLVAVNNAVDINGAGVAYRQPVPVLGDPTTRGVQFDGLSTNGLRIPDYGTYPKDSTPNVFSIEFWLDWNDPDLSHIGGVVMTDGQFTAFAHLSGLRWKMALHKMLVDDLLAADFPNQSDRSGLTHWVLMADGYTGGVTTCRIYCNGQLAASGTSALSFPATGLGSIYLGNSTLSEGIRAVLTNVSYYSRALTGSEVLDHYQKGVQAFAGRYKFDSGDATTISVSGGKLASTGTAVQKDIIDARATFKNPRVTVKHTTGTALGGTYRAGVMARRLDSKNAIKAIVSASSNLLLIQKLDNGSGTTLASTGISLATSTSYWIRLTCDGDSLKAEHWTTDPALGGAPAASVSTTLTGANAAKFGAGVEGHAGIAFWYPSQAAASLDDFTVEPELTLPVLPLFQAYERAAMLYFPPDGSGLAFPSYPDVMASDAYVPNDGTTPPGAGPGLTFPVSGWLDVIEHFTTYSFDVRVKSGLAFDRGAFSRAVARFRPAHLTCSITEVP